jgi:acyl carrier protein
MTPQVSPLGLALTALPRRVRWPRLAGVRGEQFQKGDDMTRAEISARLLGFIRERFLDNDLKSDLGEATPLLDWGILDSMNTAVLLNFIRTEFEAPVPSARINGQNFKDVNSITSMILALPDTAVARD